jgi:deazaflavin-dependent oxidoreductase (nitroreductase family)
VEGRDRRGRGAVSWLDAHVDEECCDLTTTGRRSGRPHEIEIWFAVAVAGDVLYVVSGNGPGSDWYRNALADPQVTVRLGGVSRRALARDVTDAGERRMVGDLMDAKYPSYEDLSLGLKHHRWAYDVPALAVEQWSPITTGT